MNKRPNLKDKTVGEIGVKTFNKWKFTTIKFAKIFFKVKKEKCFLYVFAFISV